MAKSIGVNDCELAIGIKNLDTKDDAIKKLILEDSLNNYFIYYKGNLISLSNSSSFYATTTNNKQILYLLNDKNDNGIQYYENISEKKKTIYIGSFVNDDLILSCQMYGNEIFRKKYGAEKVKDYLKFYNKPQADEKLVGEPLLQNLDDRDSTITIKYDVKKNYQMQGNLIYFPFPSRFQIPVPKDNNRLSPFRLFPYDINQEFILRDIPDGYELLGPKKNIRKIINLSDITISYEFTISHNEEDDIIFSRKFNVSKGKIIPVEDVNEYINIISNIHQIDKKNLMIFLEKNK